MNSVVINIKTEEMVKIQAQNIAAQLGLNLSSLINAFLKQLIRTRKIEFDLGEEPSSYLKLTLKKAEDNYKKGKVSPTFKTGEESVKWLEQQGI